MHSLIFRMAFAISSIFMVPSSLFAAAMPELLSPTYSSVVRTLKYAKTPEKMLKNINLMFDKKPFSEVRDMLSEKEQQTDESVFHLALKLALTNQQYDAALNTLLHVEYKLLQKKKYLSYPLSLSLTNSTGQTVAAYLEALAGTRDQDEKELCFDDAFEENSFVKRIRCLAIMLEWHKQRCLKIIDKKYQPRTPSPQVPTPNSIKRHPFTWPSANPISFNKQGLLNSSD